MNLTTGSIPKQVLRYTVPLIASALVQLLFNAADLVVLGLCCGSEAVAAVGSTTSVIHLLIELFLGFSSGVSVLVAQSIGAEKPDATSKAVHSAIPLGFLCGLLLIAVGIPFSRTGLRLINVPEEILDQAVTYMQIYILGVLPTILYNFGAAILNANGETKKPLVYLTVSGIVNILLNLLFVIVFHMDVVGVALATALSQLLSCVLVLRELCTRKDASRLDLKKLCFHKPSIVRILKVGLPSGLQSSFYSFANVFINSHLNTFGTAAIAGNSAATSIGGFISATINNYGVASMNFVGQNFGAKKYDRIHLAKKWSTLYSFVFGVAASGLALLFAKPLLSLYISDSPEAIAFGYRKLLVAYTFFFMQGITGTSSGAMRGLGVSLPPMIISILGIGALRLVWLYVVIDVLGYNTIDMVYLTYTVSWTVTATMMAAAWAVTKRKVLLPLEKEQAVTR